jgi:hypothetical protein
MLWAVSDDIQWVIYSDSEIRGRRESPAIVSQFGWVSPSVFPLMNTQQDVKKVLLSSWEFSVTQSDERSRISSVDS